MISELRSRTVHMHTSLVLFIMTAGDPNIIENVWLLFC